MKIRTCESALEGVSSRDDIPMEKGIKHNALDDAKIQAKQISIFYNKLEELKK